ncbi:KIN17-like protein [Dissostichus eleginoides]|uniref:KIN17-like protein n=1 Tax=Dissostichus eleginoides TaxID=100907 RepID=A0AAD9B516_DISEL|nr:KIN17-like protein [Dissostichus eleginoides]
MHALQAAGASTVVLNVRVRLCVRPAAAHLPLPLLTRDGNNGIPGAEITPRQVEPPHNARGQQRLQWRIRVCSVSVIPVRGCMVSQRREGTVAMSSRTTVLELCGREML